jgi:hypothetical protein
VRANTGERAGHRPQLRLVTVEEAAETITGLSPRMTLTELYRHWFEDVVLIGERDAAESTVVLWRKSLDWWAVKTGDPPLNQIDEHTLAGFHVAMRTATYSRAKIGGKRYNVEPITQKRIVQHVQAMLSRAVQKKLLDEAPRLRIKRVRTRKKPAFTSRADRVDFRGDRRMRRPARICPCDGRVFARTAGFALISGVRKGTFFALEWSWFVKRPTAGGSTSPIMRCPRPTAASASRFPSGCGFFSSAGRASASGFSQRQHLVALALGRLPRRAAARGRASSSRCRFRLGVARWPRKWSARAPPSAPHGPGRPRSPRLGHDRGLLRGQRQPLSAQLSAAVLRPARGRSAAALRLTLSSPIFSAGRVTSGAVRRLLSRRRGCSARGFRRRFSFTGLSAGIPALRAFRAFTGLRSPAKLQRGASRQDGAISMPAVPSRNGGAAGFFPGGSLS